jgi:hypothetical protein
MEDMLPGFVMKHHFPSFWEGRWRNGQNFDTNFGSLIGLLLRRTPVLLVILFNELLTAKSQRIRQEHKGFANFAFALASLRLKKN